MSVIDGGDLLDSAAAGPAAIRGSAVRAAGYLIGALLSLGSAALLFRHLGVADGGRYVTVQSVAMLAAGITDAGLTSIGVREYAVQSGSKRDQTMRDLLGLRLALATAGGLGGVLFSVLAGYPSTMIAGTAICVLAVLLMTLQHSYGVGLMAELRQGWVTAADVARQAAQAVIIGILALAGAALLPFFLAIAAGGLVAVGIVAWVARGTVPLTPSLRPSRWRALLAETLPYAIATAVGVIYFRLAILLLSLISDADQTGYFGASFRGVEVIIAIPALLVGGVFPILARAARDDHARLQYATGKITDVSIVLGAAVALALGVGAPVAIDVVAGDAFKPAADVLRIQGIGLFCSFLASGWAFAAIGMRMHGAVLRANLIALVVCAGLVGALAPGHGAEGAAIATSVAELCLAASYAVSLAQAGIPVIVDWSRASRTALALAAGLLPALLTALPLLVRVTLCEFVFAAVVLLLGALPEELSEHLPGWMRRA